jgi:hypothetical protein
MKKNLLIVAILAIFAGLFSACDPIEVTDEALLTQSKGWVLSAASSSPSYALSDGSFATDLINDGYLYDCEVDDILYFYANGGLAINPGANLCEETDDEYASTWTLTSNENGKFLEFQIPFFYDNELEVAEVLALSAEELRVKYTFTDDESPAKGTYSFTLTYVPVK